MLIDGEKHFEIEVLTAHRMNRQVAQYKVKWKGYGDHMNTWEDADEIPKIFQERYQNRTNLARENVPVRGSIYPNPAEIWLKTLLPEVMEAIGKKISKLTMNDEENDIFSRNGGAACDMPAANSAVNERWWPDAEYRNIGSGMTVMAANLHFGWKGESLDCLTVLGSASQQKIYDYVVKHRLSNNSVDELMSILCHKDFHTEDLSYITKLQMDKAIHEEWQSQMCISKEMCKEERMDMDGDQLLTLHYKPLLDVVRELVGDSRWSKDSVYKFQFQFKDVNVDGHPERVRIFGELNSGMWWQRAEDYVREIDGNGCVICVILWSDETQAFDGAYPLMVSIGNHTCLVRFKECAARCVALLPMVKKTQGTYSESGKGSVEWRQTEIYHDCMDLILAGFKEAGENGVQWICADGQVRTCVPLLAFIAGQC